MNAFVTLDAGTGGGKCVILGERGAVLGAHRIPWSYETRQNAEVPDVTEYAFDPRRFWQILCACLSEAVARAGIAAKDVVGVTTTSQRQGCVLLGARGEEVYAGPNLDARAFRQGLDVLARLGAERLHAITGHSAPFIFPLARYLWFRETQGVAPQKLLMINDWMTYRLSGQLTAEPSNAGESMLFDVVRRDWSEEIVDALDIERSSLPDLAASGTRVGELTRSAAAQTGLLEGTPVFNGGADTQCALLGAGLVEAADSGAILGTTAPVMRVTDAPVLDPSATLWAGCHVIEGRWVVESNAGDTGDTYQWLLELLVGRRPDDGAYERGEQLTRGRFAAPVMAFIGPTIFDLTHMNLRRPGGLLFPFPGVQRRPDRSTLLRAYMESVGYALRANLEQIDALFERPSERLTLGGGMTRSATLVSAIADILGREIGVNREPEATAVGGAVLTAVATGTSLKEALSRMTGRSEVWGDPERSRAYQPAYAKWRELYAGLDRMQLER